MNYKVGQVLGCVCSASGPIYLRTQSRGMTLTPQDFELDKTLYGTMGTPQKAIYPSLTNTTTSRVHSTLLFPRVIIDGRQTIKNCEASEIFLYLRANKLLCYSIMDAGR